jgi:DNA-binding HxlR family transcriptional regulator
VLGRLYEDEVCSAARALEAVGERWSLIIIRNAMFAGTTRFTDFQRSLGVASNVLAKRLDSFVAAGLFELRPSLATGHAEYFLTPKGLDLKPVVIALTEWGDRWAAPDGPPVTYEHEDCHGRVELRMRCTRCDQDPPAAKVGARVAQWAIDRKNANRQRGG